MRANNLRKGNVVLFNDAPCRVIDFTHVTPGKGQAVVQTKMRNLLTGTQTETRFGATEDVPMADVYTSKATYLYKDGDNFYFMDTSSYEQFALTVDFVDDAKFYLQDNMEVTVTTYNDQPIGIELPGSVVMIIVQTEPELKGATANNSPKPAITDTGLTVYVPPFIKEGQKIEVSTADGKYLGKSSD
ncbi:MAG: elongation factor P [Bdellovibrionales bacterium]|nr:elongation factor P [Bdellovibrionales bacterium]